MKIIVFLVFICSSLWGSDLHRAIKLGKETDAQLLIRNAQLDTLNTLDPIEGLAPIHLAVLYNQPETLKKLLFKKTDYNILSKQGETPIISAFKLKNYAILQIFQENKITLENETFYLYLFGRNLKEPPPYFERLSKNKQVFISKIEDLKLHNTISYTYGLFYTDFDFFDTLLNFSKKDTDFKHLAANILRELAFEAFPSGLPNQGDLRKINELMNEVEITPHLRLKFWKTIEKLGQEAFISSYNRPLKILTLGDYLLKT